MRKPSSTKQLAVDILARSRCFVQVGAAIEDNRGILSWGWNSEGFDGFGLHAEAHAIFRANKRRLRGSKIYIASKWRLSHKITLAKPCPDCQRLIDKWELKPVWRIHTGEWSA